MSQRHVVDDNLIQVLKAEDEALVQAEYRLEQAQADWELISARYAAVRDVVTERVGRSPYIIGEPKVDFPSNGAYRFIHMSMTDAVLQLLEESGGSFRSVDSLTEELRGGGLDVSDARSVNAGLQALYRRGAIVRDANGQYALAPEPEKLELEEIPEAEDIPFE